MVNTEFLKRFPTDYTENLASFEYVPTVSKRLLNHYARCYHANTFSYRILLPRSIDSSKDNDISRKLGLQLQNDLLSGIRSLKLKPNIKDYRYVHDDSHFGWLLLDPSLTIRFDWNQTIVISFLVQGIEFKLQQRLLVKAGFNLHVLNLPH